MYFRCWGWIVCEFDGLYGGCISRGVQEWVGFGEVCEGMYQKGG